MVHTLQSNDPKSSSSPHTSPQSRISSLETQSDGLQGDVVASCPINKGSDRNNREDVHAFSQASACDPRFAHRSMRHCFEALMTTEFQPVLIEEQTTLIPDTIVTDAQISTAAVVGICRISQKIVAQQFLQLFAKKLKGAQSIIMLCVDEGGPVDIEQFHDAMRTFRRFGASETILQRSRGKKLILDVTLAARRVKFNLMQIHGELGRNKDAFLYDSDAKKFWPYCHDLVAGFPQLEDYRPHLTVGSLVASRLILGEVSHGSSGVVFKCVKRSNGSLEALKAIHKSRLYGLPQIKAVAMEISLLQKLNHANIVKLHRAIHTHDYIILLMDFAGNLNLCRYVKDAGYNCNEQAGDILWQLVSGIAHCHRARVAHRDVKPVNIVVGFDGAGSVSFKIVDFGCAIDTSTACTDSCGTLPFVAPEVFLRDEGEHYDPTCVDVWACGITFVELLCGVGKVDEMLQCETSNLNKYTYAVKVKSMCIHPGKLWQLIESHRSVSNDNSMPGGPKVPLLGMLNLSPTLRWNAEQVACWARPWRKPR